MRTREDIERELQGYACGAYDCDKRHDHRPDERGVLAVAVEVLLDIRDLLEKQAQAQPKRHTRSRK